MTVSCWQGPFEIQQRMGPTTYQVSTPGQSRSSRVLHVNLLKEWVERPDKKAEVLLIKRFPEDEEVEEQYLPAAASLHLDLSHLPEGKQLYVRALCYSEIFQENPGRTNLVEHDIVLKEGASVTEELQNTRTSADRAEGGDRPNALSGNC